MASWLSGVTMLMSACNFGNERMVNLLLEHKASLDMQDSDSVTALMMASLYGHAAIVRLLLRAGARTDLRAPNGKTALDIAKDNCHTECAREFREHATRTTEEARARPAPNDMASTSRDEGGECLAAATIYIQGGC